jgi:WD40 repeat protein
MMPCTCTRHLQRFLDGVLDDSEWAELERHVETCERCQNELEHLTGAITMNWPVPPVPWGDDVRVAFGCQPPPPDGELPRVPGYEVRGELGIGGMGVIYRAYDLKLKREVALKMVRADRRVRPGDLARFRTDAEALARLRHDNIVQIYEVGESNGRPYFTLELAEGGSLEKTLNDRPQPPDNAARLVETLARAAHYAHQRGVIHRDLKPGNVLLAGVPKITDFGLAKFLDAVGVSTCLTLPDLPLGTPAYMAWEQGTGKVEEISILTDVYGLGAILYRLLTGHAPYEGANNLEIIRKVQSLEEVPTRPGRLNASLPPDLELICLKCLEKQPHRRYASAEQLADELRRFLNHEPPQHTRTRPVGRGERIRLWCRRNPALAAACAIAFLTLLAGTAVSAAFWRSNARTAGELQTALDESKEKGRLLGETNRKAADHALALGLHVCEQGDVALGILWLAHSLETAPPEAKDLQRVIRANLAAWGDALRPLRAVLPGPREVLAVAFSPDGKRIATGTAGGTAQLWDAATGAPVGAPLRRAEKISAVAFSPDGKTALIGSWDKTACLWDVATGRVVVLPHPDEVWAVAFSPDGKTVLTGSGAPLTLQKPRRGEARLWDAAGGTPLHVLPHGGRVYVVAFGRDGRSVLTACADSNARLWDASSGDLLHTLPHDGPVWVATFSPDHNKVLTGSFDKTARVWDAATGKLIAQLPHTAEVYTAAFSPDGKAVLTGSINRLAQRWNAKTGAALGPPLSHPGPVVAAAFSPDGKAVLTGCGDRTARLWDVATGNPLGPALLNLGEVRAVAFSPDGQTALTGSQDVPGRAGQARLWDLRPKYATAPLRSPGKVSALALTPDGKLALVAGENGKTWLCDLATGELVGEPFLPHGKVWAAAFRRDGRAVVLATTGETAGLSSTFGTACQWDVASREPFGPILRCGKVIKAVAYSPDGLTILTGIQGLVRLWDAATGDPVGEPLRHEGDVGAMAFGPDGKTALIGCQDGTARHWDLTSGRALVPVLRHDKAGSVDRRKEMLAVALSPDGKTALTGGRDGRCRFWDVATGKPIGPPLAAHPDPVLTGAFSADGKEARTATASEVRRWAVPAPVEGDAERIVLWSQAVTGTELDGGAVRRLDSQTWQERRQRLRALGGPPRP